MGPYYLGIDPGVSGGIAALDEEGHIVLKSPMPKTEAGIFETIARLGRRGAPLVLGAIEVVHSSPQMGVVSAFTFGRSYGALRMALTAAGVPFLECQPKVWQATMGVQYPKAAKGEKRPKRDKNVSKLRAIHLFGPNQHITHATADALLIASYARRAWREKD